MCFITNMTPIATASATSRLRTSALWEHVWTSYVCHESKVWQRGADQHLLPSEFKKSEWIKNNLALAEWICEMAQEAQNERIKARFAIQNDAIPGSTVELTFDDLGDDPGSKCSLETHIQKMKQSWASATTQKFCDRLMRHPIVTIPRFASVGLRLWLTLAAP